MEQQRLRLLFADQLNTARGKYIRLESVKEKGESSVGICRSLYGVSYDCDLLPVTGAAVLEGIADMEMRFDRNSLRPGWERNTVVAIPDLYDTQGKPLDLDGRGALRRAIGRWQDKGLEPYLGLELEANVFERNDEGEWELLAPRSASAYSTGSIADPARVADTLWDAAAAAGLRVDAINGEYDSGCFELTLDYAPALEAVDDIFIFRTMAKELMYNRGYWLSFMPKPTDKAGGCGLHVNFSLRDKQGNNALNDEGKADGLSDLGRRCVAGWMKYHSESAALLAPISNSYERLKPSSMSGYWTNWAFDHRGVTVRISHEGGSRRRLEHRTADCASNPYVAAAALLNTARLGVEESLELQEAEAGDCLESQQAIAHVPGNLAKAVEALAASTTLRKEMSDMLIDNFVDMKREELKKIAGLKGEDVADFYFPFI